MIAWEFRHREEAGPWGEGGWRPKKRRYTARRGPLYDYRGKLNSSTAGWQIRYRRGCHYRDRRYACHQGRPGVFDPRAALASIQETVLQLRHEIRCRLRSLQLSHEPESAAHHPVIFRTTRAVHYVTLVGGNATRLDLSVEEFRVALQEFCAVHSAHPLRLAQARPTDSVERSYLLSNSLVSSTPEVPHFKDTYGPIRQRGTDLLIGRRPAANRIH